MQVDIEYCQVELDKALEAHVQRKLEFALSRLEVDISAISIVLSDVTHARGGSGNDKHCLLTISIAGLSDIVIEDTQADLYCVIDRVIQKANHLITRQFLPK